MDLEKQYQELAEKIREEYFPILKKKREELKYSRQLINSLLKDWGVTVNKQSDYSPELIFKLNAWFDEELEIKKEMAKVNLHEVKA